jgi:hypothetical protein
MEATMKLAAPLFATTLLIAGFIAYAGVNITPVMPTAASDPFNALQSQSQRLREAIATNYKDENISKTAIEIGRRLETLVDQWTKSKPQLSTDYRATLKHDANLLERVAKGEKKEDASADLAAVLRDLTAKMNLAKGPPGAAGVGNDYLAVVNVTVITQLNGAIVGNYDVGFNPLRYEDETKSLFPFDAPSSPTSRDIPAGSFSVRISKDGKLVKAEDHDIGLSGQKKQTIRVEIGG